MKNILFENDFTAATTTLLLNIPSNLTLKALEDCTLICVNFKKFKALMETKIDIKDIYIKYLENNWLIIKEQTEISLALENADQRYLALLAKHPTIEKRVPQHYLASHLGITPTQLSRIRKRIKD